MDRDTITQMWTIAEAAVRTNVTPFFVRKLVRENKIKYIKSGCKYLINAQSLCDYLNGKEGDK